MATACNDQTRRRQTRTNPVEEPELTRIPNPDDALEPVDTAVVVVVPPDPIVVPPVTVPKEGSSPRATPQLSLMMPFFGNRFDTTNRYDLPDNSKWALQYYGGLKLALFDLEAEGIKANVHVFDSQGDAGVAQRLMSDPELRASHALIAPYLTPAVKAVVDPAKAIGMPLIVPFSAAADLASGYPQMLQINPGLATHLDQIAAYLARTYEAAQVVLMGLPDGSQDRTVAYLLQQQAKLMPGKTAWRTWRLETSESSMKDLDWTDRFAESGTSVFVFPIYDRPAIVNGLMSQLQLQKAGRDVELVGMPQWADMKQLDPTMMESHAVTITSGPMIDSDDYDVREFSERFVDAYDATPDLPAFLGYDAARYALPLISKYGISWTEHLPASFDGLVSKYELRPVYSLGSADGSPGRTADRYENASVDVLHFRNFGFQAEER